MFDETHAAEATDIVLFQNLYCGSGHAGCAIGGWTFKFTLLEWDWPGCRTDPIYTGQMTLSNGSTSGSIVVSHISGSVLNLSQDHQVLSFHGCGEESLRDGSKFLVNVSATFAFNKTTDTATGYVIVGNARYAAAAGVKLKQ